MMNVLTESTPKISSKKDIKNNVILLKDYYFGSDGKYEFIEYVNAGYGMIRNRPIESELPKIYLNYYTHGNNNQTLLSLILEKIYKNYFFLIKIFKAIIPGFNEFLCHKEYLFKDTYNSILDVGCGSGFYRKYFSSCNHYDGIEIDRSCYTIAKSNGVNIISKNLRDINHLGKKRKKYELLFLHHYLEHSYRPLDDIEILKRLLSNSEYSCIKIVTPNLNSLGRLLFNKYWRGYEAPRHCYLFTQKYFVNLFCNDVEFEVSTKTTFANARSFVQIPCYLNKFENKIIKGLFNLIQLFISLIYQIFCTFYFYFDKDSGDELIVEIRRKFSKRNSANYFLYS